MKLSCHLSKINNKYQNEIPLLAHMMTEEANQGCQLHLSQPFVAQLALKFVHKIQNKFLAIFLETLSNK